jgi:hypothetical protein
VSGRKAKAAQACFDRFAGKARREGANDCARLACHALHHAGVPVAFLKGKRWNSEAAGFRLLRSLGFADLIEAVDAVGLERIAPARAVAGDIVALPCEDERWGCALTVALGNGRVIGFLDGRAQVVRPLAFVTAWRV